MRRMESIPSIFRKVTSSPVPSLPVVFPRADFLPHIVLSHPWADFLLRLFPSRLDSFLLPSFSRFCSVLAGRSRSVLVILDGISRLLLTRRPVDGTRTPVQSDGKSIEKKRLSK